MPGHEGRAVEHLVVGEVALQDTRRDLDDTLSRDRDGFFLRVRSADTGQCL